MIVGILGAGQLARMLALAGKPLGLKFVFLDPSEEACAADLGEHLVGDYSDPGLLVRMSDLCDVITYEFENVPVNVIDTIAAEKPVFPSAKALRVGQDRLTEKDFFRSLGVETAPYAEVNTISDLKKALEKIGWPAILKTRRFGYDGKGQVLSRSASDLEQAWAALQGAQAIVEGFVPFQREVSIIAVRSVSGSIRYYPLSENTHRGGILRLAKCTEHDPLQEQAEAIIYKVMEALDYVGILALEMFAVNGRLVANEFAPRVHNSGHWTIEGSETSQFENHLRAILDLPLGETKTRGYAAMQNFIGGAPTAKEVLGLTNVHLHLYDKAPRKGRKIAHATVRTDTAEALSGKIAALTKLADQYDDS